MTLSDLIARLDAWLASLFGHATSPASNPTTHLPSIAGLFNGHAGQPGFGTGLGIGHNPDIGFITGGMPNPAVRGNIAPPVLPSGLVGHNYDAGLGAYQYVGDRPGTFNPAGITMYQTATDLGNANPANAADVAYIATNYYRGDQAAAVAGITNARASQSGDWSNPVVAANQAKINPVGTYLNQHPGATVQEANRALGITP